jgi:hypothetical protein
MASTGGRRWSMHTFDAISEDEVVRGERMRRARAFRKSREAQRRDGEGDARGAIVVRRWLWEGRSEARQAEVVVLLFWLSSVSTVDDVCGG